jgi:uncharacterized BrkB/YihY/UPF0761 family membrane protein
VPSLGLLFALDLLGWLVGDEPGGAFGVVLATIVVLGIAVLRAFDVGGTPPAALSPVDRILVRWSLLGGLLPVAAMFSVAALATFAPGDPERWDAVFFDAFGLAGDWGLVLVTAYFARPRREAGGCVGKALGGVLWVFCCACAFTGPCARLGGLFPS